MCQKKLSIYFINKLLDNNFYKLAILQLEKRIDFNFYILENNYYLYSPFLLNDKNFDKLELILREKLVLMYIKYYLKYIGKSSKYKELKKLFYLEKKYLKKCLNFYKSKKYSENIFYCYFFDNIFYIPVINFKELYFNTWKKESFIFKNYKIINGFFYFRNIISLPDKILLKLYSYILY